MEESAHVPFDNIQHPKKRAMLLGLATHTNRVKAARAAKIERTTHYHWLATDPEYAEAVKEALKMGCDALEDEATRRAFSGSDVLLIVRLKAEFPEKYRERWQGELTGKNGAPLMSEEQSRKALEATAPPPPTD